jgi:hypothetical protein
VEVVEDAGVAEGAVESSVLEVAHGEEEVGEAGALGAEEVGVVVEDPAGLEKRVVVHDRQCLMRFPGLPDRANSDADAISQPGISNLA